MQWIWFEDYKVRSAADNMAADQRLLDLQAGSPDSCPVVRIYTWGEPAVTCGRLQRLESVQQAYPDLEVARRPSGGRAVLHGDDLTVTVALRETVLANAAGASVDSSFRAIAQAVIEALNKSGQICGFGEGRRRADNHVDCFAHAASCDIVNYETNEKIVGCAQRRVDGAILQQMSIVRHKGNREFPAILRASMSSVYGANEWRFVDSEMALCYTGPISTGANVQGRELI